MEHAEVLEKIFKLRKEMGLKKKNRFGRINAPLKVCIKKIEEFIEFRPKRQGGRRWW